MERLATEKFLSRNHSSLLVWSVVCGLWPILSGCAPSYAPHEAADHVLKLLQKEYQMSARTKLHDSTLGICYTVNNLIDSQLNLISTQLEDLQQVVLVMHRVGLSSGDQLQFYEIIAQDPTSGAELALVGSFLDVRRVRLLDISRNEYFKRIIRDLRFNPEILGEITCRKLFAELSVKKTELALEEYYSKKVAPGEITTVLFPTSLVALPDTTEFQIQQVQTKRIGETKALLLCQTREFYTPNPEFGSLMTLFPQGFQNKYLMVIDTTLYPRPIERIIPKYTVDEQSRIKEQPLQQIFNSYPNLIEENDRFLVESYTLPTFLAELIEHRIRDDVQRDDELSKVIRLRSVQGSFNSDKKDFTFSLVAIPIDLPEDHKDAPTDVKLLETSLRTTAEVLKGYWFKDYEAVNFVDALSGETFSIQRESVNQFRLKKIGIQELIQHSSYLTPFNP